MTDSIAIGEVQPCHGLVDHSHVRGVVVLGFIPDSPVGQRNAQNREIARAYEINANPLLVAPRLAEDLHGGLPAV